MTGVVNTTGARSGNVGTITAPAVGTGTDGYLFTATGAGIDPAWEAAAAATVGEVGFMAYNSADSWLTYDNAEVAFPQERYDNGSNYSTSTYRFTAPATGLYHFSASVYTANSDGSNSFGFYKDGSENSSIAGSNAQSWGQTVFTSATDDHIQAFTAIYYLTSGDEISIGSFELSDFYTGHSWWMGGRIF